MIFDGRYKYIVCERFGPMLFDLKSDPQEFVNLGDDPAYAAERARLDKLLLEWALKPRQRVTIAEGTSNAMDVQRNISEAGILIGYYDEADHRFFGKNGRTGQFLGISINLGQSTKIQKERPRHDILSGRNR